MRLQGSRFSQILLVGLTILSALGVGYVVGQLLGGGGRPPAAVQLPPVIESGVSPDQTATAGDLATEVPSQVAVVAMPSIAPSAAPEASPTIESGTTTGSIGPETPAADVFIEENFESPTPTFPVTETATWSAAYVGGRYQLNLNGQTNIGLVGDLPAPNYRLTVDIMVDQGGAGVVFLSGQPRVSYRLLLTSDGAYAIERQEANTATKVEDWTENLAIRPGAGAVNQLRVERIGTLISFFVNGALLTTFDVPPGNFVNRYGFVLTSRVGQGQAAFDNLRGERLPEP